MNLAIISGASKGIGLETALMFLKNNWEVIGLSRTQSKNPKIQHISIDLSTHFDSSFIISACEQKLKKAKKICFVHCAGITTADTINNFNEATLRRIYEINVISAVRIIHFLLPYMKKKSSVILIGSTLSYLGVPLSLSYTLSKHALAGLARSITQDVSNQEIHCCCICPGFVETDMLKKVSEQRSCLIEDFKSMQIFNRLIHPCEIAEVVYFCAEHPIVNGSLIQANYG